MRQLPDVPAIIGRDPNSSRLDTRIGPSCWLRVSSSRTALLVLRGGRTQQRHSSDTIDGAEVWWLIALD